MYAYADKKQSPDDKKNAGKPKITTLMNTAAPNVTGIPDPMKTRFENLSDFSFGDVRVHYNSSKPTQLHALAFTQGNQVYAAPEQETHLGHELGHVVQQKQARVHASIGSTAVNDDRELEREADDAGYMSLQLKSVVVQNMDDGEKSIDVSVLSGLDKETFLLTLRDKITETSDKLLAQINQTSADCPYIIKWFGFYSKQDKEYIEKAVARFAPASASAESIEEYIDAIAERVKVSLQKHINTGTAEDVPDELIDEQHDPQEPEEFLHIAEKSQPVAQLSRRAPPPIGTLYGRRNVGGFGGQNYRNIRKGFSPNEQLNQYIDDGGTHNFQLGWHSGVEFIENGGQFQITNLHDFGGNLPQSNNPPVQINLNNIQGANPQVLNPVNVSSIATRGVDSCTVIILSGHGNQRAMLHLDRMNLVQGRQRIDQIHQNWGGAVLGQPHNGQGIDRITVSYADDPTAPSERTTFINNLRNDYVNNNNFVPNANFVVINRGYKDGVGNGQHSEIGLGFNGQNAGIFGDLISPDLSEGGQNEVNFHAMPIASSYDQRLSAYPVLDQIKSKPLDEIRTRQSNPNRPQNTKRITFEALYQPGNIQTLENQINAIRW